MTWDVAPASLTDIFFGKRKKKKVSTTDAFEWAEADRVSAFLTLFSDERLRREDRRLTRQLPPGAGPFS